MTTTPADARREAARRRSQEYRDRRRRGALVVSIEVQPGDVHGLERLGLLPRGDRDPYAVACAVAQFLTGARAVADLGAALFPAGTDAA